MNSFIIDILINIFSAAIFVAFSILIVYTYFFFHKKNSKKNTKVIYYEVLDGNRYVSITMIGNDIIEIEGDITNKEINAFCESVL